MLLFLDLQSKKNLYSKELIRKPNFSDDPTQLTDSWLGLMTVEKTEGLNVGRCRVSCDICESNGLILVADLLLEFGVWSFELEAAVFRSKNLPLLPPEGVCVERQDDDDAVPSPLSADARWHLW